MPFGTYEVNPEKALENAIMFIKMGNVEAVKLEGGEEMAFTISKITKVGIPVVGHIGLMPQRQSAFGGFRVQGKTLKSVLLFYKIRLKNFLLTLWRFRKPDALQ
jgi:3-methyl-2-oxobutanoate hydroxymethyltransferase